MSGSLPQTIPPQTARLGKADANGNVTIDVTWYLLLYNVCSQVLSQSNSSVTASPTDLMLIDGEDIAPIPAKTSAALATDPTDADAVAADLARVRALLQATQTLVAQVLDGWGLTAADVMALPITGGTLTGALTQAKAGIDTSYSYNTPATGATITTAAGEGRTLIDPAGTIAALTVTTPPSPVNGQVWRFASTQIVTALTITGTAGATVKAPPTSLAVGSEFQMLYRSTGTTWLPA